MCMETYQGARPFSEPETRAVSEFLKTIKDQLVVRLKSQPEFFLHIHQNLHNDYFFLRFRCTFPCTAMDKKLSTHGATLEQKFETGGI